MSLRSHSSWVLNITRCLWVCLVRKRSLPIPHSSPPPPPRSGESTGSLSSAPKKTWPISQKLLPYKSLSPYPETSIFTHILTPLSVSTAPPSQAPCLLSLQISFSLCSFAQLKTWLFVSYFKKKKKKVFPLENHTSPFLSLPTLLQSRFCSSCY